MQVPALSRGRFPKGRQLLVTIWEVAWTDQPGREWFVDMVYDHEVGTETWYKPGTGTAARDRSGHTFTSQSESYIAPGGGRQGGGG